MESLQPEPHNELTQHGAHPTRAETLSKRSLELFNLRSQEFSLEQKMKKSKGGKKAPKRKNMSPVYFFQPAPYQKKSEPSEEKGSETVVRNRARSEEMESLLKGFENILQQEEEKSHESPERKESSTKKERTGLMAL